MDPDIDPPAPPDIVVQSEATDDEFGDNGDGRRTAFQEYLEEGAWNEAVEIWTQRRGVYSAGATQSC